MNKTSIAKRLISAVLLLAVLCCALCSCSSKEPEVSMYDLCQAMSRAATLKEMKYASSEDKNPSQLLSKVADIDYGKVSSFFIYYAANGTGNADEFVVIRVKKIADTKAAEASLRSHLAARKALYASYDKTQLPKLENAQVVSSGSFAALIVADEPAKVENAFLDFLKK